MLKKPYMHRRTGLMATYNGEHWMIQDFPNLTFNTKKGAAAFIRSRPDWKTVEASTVASTLLSVLNNLDIVKSSLPVGRGSSTPRKAMEEAVEKLRLVLSKPSYVSHVPVSPIH